MDMCIFFFNDTATTEIYTLSLHDALPISTSQAPKRGRTITGTCGGGERQGGAVRRPSRSVGCTASSGADEVERPSALPQDREGSATRSRQSRLEMPYEKRHIGIHVQSLTILHVPNPSLAHRPRRARLRRSGRR